MAPELPRRLDNDVMLSVGQLSYLDEQKKFQSCPFQFNPTELERSRTIKFTRSATGNTLEEPRATETNPRNRTKHKLTRKPDPWDMTLSLRFDASHPVYADPPPPPKSPPPKEPEIWTSAQPQPSSTTSPVQPARIASSRTTTTDDAAHDTRPTSSKPFKEQIDRIANTIRFFEALAEPRPMTKENESLSNADETSPPPFVTLQFGVRTWMCAVKTVRIKEDDYTFDLYPRRFEVTLSLEIIETTRQADQGKGTSG